VFFPRALDEISVLVFVDVHQLIATKIDGIGTGGPTSVVFVRIKDLNAECFPASLGTAIDVPFSVCQSSEPRAVFTPARDD
jgi:hypothetical protein